jgi:hypothetical protein
VEPIVLKHKEHTEFSERRKTAAEAKEKLLRQFAGAPKADDPQVIARDTERQARSVAREARRAERDRLRQEDRERGLREAAAREEAIRVQAKLEAEVHEAAEERNAARTLADQMARKVERDRRYSARKARQR